MTASSELVQTTGAWELQVEAGGARLFRPVPDEDEDQPGTMDEENEPADQHG